MQRDPVHRHQATETLVDLLSYHQDHGVFPPKLLALLPDYRPQLAIDIYSGEPLRYTPTPDGGLKLYSVGRNLIDDGGSAEQNAQNRYGLDLVYWAPE